ncbi:MAG: XkdQ/YqbQ family protein [Paraclostridium sp.]
MNNNLEIIIANGNDLYEPIVEDGITFETIRKGSPGKLSLSIIKDDVINFEEGNAIRVKYKGVNVFYGFIFSKKRNKENIIQVTAYDQLRYLKNKDTYVYENKTASEVIKMIAKDFKLEVGQIDDTKYKIPTRIEEDRTLFDMILGPLDDTVENTKEMYIFYDDFGKLTLKHVNSLKLDTLIDGDTIEDFDYSSSIDGNTYNQIKLSKENKDTGKRDIYITKDSSNINKWGILQYFESVDENVNAKEKADALLKLYNQKVKSLDVKEALGDIRVRGGCLVPTVLNLGDMILQKYMLVDKVVHKFSNNQHTMDLTLVGGEFISTLATTSPPNEKKPENNNSNDGNNSSNGNNSNNSGKKVKALFSAYYAANNSLQGGLYDAQGNKLNYKNNTCAAPKQVPFGSKIKVQGTGTHLDGQIFTVTDRGGAIKIRGDEYQFDLLMKDHKTAYGWGKKKGEAIILDNNSSSSSSSSNPKANKIIEFAKTKLGTKYVWGATGPNTFDCSGLAGWCHKQAGINIPRTSLEQSRSGKSIKKNDLLPGDLVFFKTTSAPVGHVGIYVGDGKMIHTSTASKPCRYDNVFTGYYGQRYVNARRYW